MNMDKILNQLIAKLLSEGSAQFSQDGLNIKTSYDNGCLNIAASFVSPEEDNTKIAEKLVSDFETYVKSLNDEFFLEVAESFKGDALKKIQDKLDSKDLPTVKAGITEFMTRLKEIAANKVKQLDQDIEETRKELSELVKIRESYVHVINKKF